MGLETACISSRGIEIGKEGMKFWQRQGFNGPDCCPGPEDDSSKPQTAASETLLACLGAVEVTVKARLAAVSFLVKEQPFTSDTTEYYWEELHGASAVLCAAGKKLVLARLCMMSWHHSTIVEAWAAAGNLLDAHRAAGKAQEELQGTANEMSQLLQALVETAGAAFTAVSCSFCLC